MLPLIDAWDREKLQCMRVTMSETYGTSCLQQSLCQSEMVFMLIKQFNNNQLYVLLISS